MKMSVPSQYKHIPWDFALFRSFSKWYKAGDKDIYRYYMLATAFLFDFFNCNGRLSELQW